MLRYVKRDDNYDDFDDDDYDGDYDHFDGDPSPQYRVFFSLAPP